MFQPTTYGVWRSSSSACRRGVEGSEIKPPGHEPGYIKLGAAAGAPSGRVQLKPRAGGLRADPWSQQDHALAGPWGRLRGLTGHNGGLQGMGLGVETGAASRVPVPVLMYHSVSSSATSQFLPYTVRPEIFGEQLAVLKDAGYALISMAQYVANPDRFALVGRAAVLTFDDAFADFQTYVLPALDETGFSATLFVPTAYVGNTSRWLAYEGESQRPILSWTAIKEAASAGVEIGSHSRTHRQMDRLRGRALRQEVIDSKWEIEDEVQREVASFAYPFGYMNPRARRAVRVAGYASACAVRDLVDYAADPFAISRLTVHHDMSSEDVLSLVRVGEGPQRLSLVKARARAEASLLLRRVGLKRKGPTPALVRELAP